MRKVFIGLGILSVLDLTDSGGSTKLPEGTKRYIPDKHRWQAEDVVFAINGQAE